MSHSTAVTRAEGHAPALAPEHVERVAEAVEAAQRPATRRNYRQAWDRFAAWCAGEGLDALPADPVTVGAYLAVRAESRSLATVRLDRAAISDRHRRAGHPTPTRSEGVRRTVKGLANVHADAGRHVERQAPGLTADCLAAIRATAHLPRTGPTGRTESADAAKRRGAVDVALGRKRAGHRHPLEDGRRTAHPLRRARRRRRAPADRPRRPGTGRPRVRHGHGPDGIEPDRRHGQGRRTRGRVQRPQPARRHGAGLDGQRGQLAGAPGGGPVEVRPDARPLQRQGTRRARGRRQVLPPIGRGIEGEPPSPAPVVPTPGRLAYRLIAPAENAKTDPAGSDAESGGRRYQASVKQSFKRCQSGPRCLSVSRPFSTPTLFTQCRAS